MFGDDNDRERMLAQSAALRIWQNLNSSDKRAVGMGLMPAAVQEAAAQSGVSARMLGLAIADVMAGRIGFDGG